MTINPSLMQYNAMQQYNAYNAAMLNPALVRGFSLSLALVLSPFGCQSIFMFSFCEVYFGIKVTCYRPQNWVWIGYQLDGYLRLVSISILSIA